MSALDRGLRMIYCAAWVVAAVLLAVAVLG
jgi:hypothetical protein